MRVALGVEYDGTDYHGWQSQPGAVPTVQDRLQQTLTRIADHPVRVTCAGRTDAGVHASSQVVHFDTPAVRPVRAWVLGANTYLPDDVSIRWATPIVDEFHARFSALARRYRYVILNRSDRSALQHRQTTLYYRHRLDAEAMHQAGQHLLGEHDFSAFRGAGCQAKTATRDVRDLSVIRNGDRLILEIEANAFLLHMVRNIVGALLLAGTGERPPAWLAELLATRDRTHGGITAPPNGLCLAAVHYPEAFGLQRQEAMSFA